MVQETVMAVEADTEAEAVTEAEADTEAATDREDIVPADMALTEIADEDTVPADIVPVDTVQEDIIPAAIAPVVAEVDIAAEAQAIREMIISRRRKKRDLAKL